MTVISNDVVLNLDESGLFYDIGLTSDGDFETDLFFDTALIMTIFCEQRANAQEVVIPELRRGWIGNESTPGFEIGSKIWLSEQSRKNRTAMNEIKTAAENGFSWLSDIDSVIDYKVTVFLDDDGNFNLQVDINRSNSKIDNKFYTLWNNSGSQS